MNLLKRETLSRRTLLRGLGTVMSVPWLEAMGPVTAWSAEAKAGTVAPCRMAFLYVPNGVNMADWTPAEDGVLRSLPPTLEPLAALREEILVLSGLTADGALPHATQRGGRATRRPGDQAGRRAGGRIGVAWREPPVRAGDRAGQKRRGRISFLFFIAML